QRGSNGLEALLRCPKSAVLVGARSGPSARIGHSGAVIGTGARPGGQTDWHIQHDLAPGVRRKVESRNRSRLPALRLQRCPLKPDLQGIATAPSLVWTMRMPAAITCIARSPSRWVVGNAAPLRQQSMNTSTSAL